MKTSLALLLLLTVCLGCMPPFVTNVDRRQIPAFTRILVVSKLPVMLRNLPDFLSVFPEQYEVCIADAGTLALAPPDSIVTSQVRTCRSEVVLTIQLNRNYTSGAGQYMRAVNEYLLELTDTRTGQTFWKALVNGGLTAPRIVRRLKTDGVITGNVRSVPLPGARVARY